jgi:RNA polymerase sigma factor (sigma-70 family)
VEASTISATAIPATRSRATLPSAGPLLRLRSDEQLVRLFRAGNEDAFRVIHDRYRARLFAYARQMLSGSRADAEDALQDVFVRAYGALRANDREVSLRAWLYRVAHNRCIDELRRPAPPPPETFELIRPPEHDPIAITERRESLRRLVADVRRLPEQQRSALLMREIGGMSYDDVAAALAVSMPAVKSLLVRARVGLAASAEARDTACIQIREELAGAHERGVRASGLARRHLHECDDCTAYRKELRATHKRFAALVPVVGPAALLAKVTPAALLAKLTPGALLGGGATAGGATATGGAGGVVAASAGAGAAVSGGALVSATHVVAVVAAVVVGAGGAVEVQRTLAPPPHRARVADVRSQRVHVPTAPTLLSAGAALTPSLATLLPGDVAASSDPAADPRALSDATLRDGIGLSPDAAALTPGDPTAATTSAGDASGGAAAPSGLAQSDPAPPSTMPSDAAADPAPSADPTPASSPSSGESAASAPTLAGDPATADPASSSSGASSPPASTASGASSGGASAPSAGP